MPNFEAEVPSCKTNPFHITVHGTIERVLSTRYSCRDETSHILRGKIAVNTEIKATLEDFEWTLGESARWGTNATPGHHKNESVIV